MRFLAKAIGVVEGGFQVLYSDYRDYSTHERVRVFETLGELFDWLEVRAGEVVANELPRLEVPPDEGMPVKRTDQFVKRLKCGHGVPRSKGAYQEMCPSCQRRFEVEVENLRRGYVSVLGKGKAKEGEVKG